MGKKVTGGQLKTLIERITNNLVDPSVELYTGKEGDEAPDNAKNKENWSNVGVKSKIQDRASDFSELAATQATDGVLDDADLEAAINDMLSRFSKQIQVDKADARYKRDQALAAMRKSGSSEIQSKITNIFQNTLDKVELSDEEAKLLLGDIESYFDALDYQDVTPFAGQQIPVAGVQATEVEFEKSEKPKVSPYILDLFGGVDGSSVADKLKSVSDFSKAAEEGTLQSWTEGRDEFAPFIYSKVLSFLAEEIKTLGAREAGSFFERWLAVLLNFPVVGAEGGAADNLGKIGSDTIYTSAKLYSNLVGEYAPSQSTKNLLDITTDNVVYYFIGQKLKGSEEKVEGFSFIPAVDLYLVEISQENGELKGRFVLPTAREGSSSWTLSPKSETQSYLLPGEYTSNEDFQNFKYTTVYLPQGEITDGQLQTTAKFLSDEVGKLTDRPATKAILDAATKIKTIEANTDSYVGKSKQKKGSATDYIDKIYTDYNALEDLYKQIFAYGEDEESPAVQNENRISSDHLKKLISESFNK